MATRSSSKQMTINLVASIIAFGVNIGINFFLTPYLVSSLGTEAYGFIGLANNFVQYATIITAALNSMSGRFISVAYHQGNKEKASKIFSSVLVADLILAFVLLIGTAIFTFFLDSVFNIPENLVTSVKITFGLTFLTFVVSVVTAIFTTATFVKNRIDINSIRDIISNLIKVALIVGLFTFFPSQLYYIALATLGSGIFLLLANITVKKRILPDIKVDIKKFQFSLVKMLIASGIWMSLVHLSSTLLNGLDLLICNLTLGATIMGLMSIAKTVPQSIALLTSTLANVFTPQYTILYAKGKIDELVSQVKFSSKIISYILTVPIAGFIAFGNEFYTLWQPTRSPEEINMIQIISVLTCLMYLFTAHTQGLTVLSTVCNNLKLPVLVSLGIGIVSTVSVIVILNVTDIGNAGAYVIAGISSLLMSLRAILFIPIYSAHLLKQKKTVFYPTVFRGWFSFGVVFALFLILRLLPLNLTSWITFLPFCIAIGIVGYILCIPLMFNKKEMKKFKGAIKKKLKRN